MVNLGLYLKTVPDLDQKILGTVYVRNLGVLDHILINYQGTKLLDVAEVQLKPMICSVSGYNILA